MDWTTLIGIIMGTILLLVGILLDGDLGPYVSLRSVIIVLGGTLAATVVNFPAEQMKHVKNIMKVAFTTPKASAKQVINMLVAFAEKARREGLLAMEEEAEALEDEFMRKGVQLVVDGADPETVRTILDIELAYLEDRHRTGQNMFETMGLLAPAWGMIGTLIGLVQMLVHLDDPEMIAPGLAVALITTLYGVILANLVFNPLAGKLRVRSEEEVLLKELVTEGIIAIQAGENPRMVEQKLWAFLSPAARSAAEEEEGEEAQGERVVTPDAP